MSKNKFPIRFSLNAVTLTFVLLFSVLPLVAQADNTLLVDISANPLSGSAPLNGVDLTAVVSGTAQGPITYRFDCTSDGSWEQTQVLSQTSYTATDICNYPSPGNYTATVRVDRENLSFQGTLAILVQSQAAPTVDLKINGSDGTITVAYNTAATLSWTSTNATSCTASGDWSGTKAISGSESTGNLINSKSYSITCTGPGGSASDSVGANVQQSPPTVDLKINGSDGTISVAYNSSATLSWTSTNANSCYATGNWSGTKSVSGSESTGNLTSSTTYTVTCTGPGGSASDSVGANVQQQSLPTVDLKINGSDGTITVAYNSAATLSWTSNNANYCIASGDWSGTKSVSGSESTGNLISSKTYSIYCVGNGGNSATDTVGALVSTPQLQDISVTKLVRNVSNNTSFQSAVTAAPGELLEFRITVTALGASGTNDSLTVRDVLPSQMSFYGNLTVDGVPSTGSSILTGLSLGTFSSQQTKTIVFQATVAPATSFAFGTTTLTNTANAYNSSNTVNRAGSAQIQIVRTQVLGATNVPTGAFDPKTIGLSLLALAGFAATYFVLLKSYLKGKSFSLGFVQFWRNIRQGRDLNPVAKSQQRLVRLAKEIREKENL